MERKVRTIEARRPNGDVVLIDEYQDFIDVTSKGGAPESMPGMKRLALRSGGAVNFIDDHTFKVVSSDEILTVP